MKNIFKTLAGLFVLLIIISSCKKDTYTMDEITDPVSIDVTYSVVGQDAAHPNGDSSGKVTFHVSSTDGIAYSMDYDASTPEAYENLQSGTVTHRFTKNGLFTYNVTAKVTGEGGINSITKVIPITVVFKFVPDSNLVKAVTGATFDGTGSKTWRVDSAVSAHFGVGPYNPGSVRPEWYGAAPNEKTGCCLCFYTAKFTFTKISPFIYNLSTSTPNGVFTKTGADAGGLPGIPSTGPEACYTYGPATSTFVWIPAGSGVPAASAAPGNSNSTQTSLQLEGNNTFIGYGAVKKEYEILTYSDTSLYLRVQGTETGNAWYLKLKNVP